MSNQYMSGPQIKALTKPKINLVGKLYQGLNVANEEEVRALIAANEIFLALLPEESGLRSKIEIFNNHCKKKGEKR